MGSHSNNAPNSSSGQLFYGAPTTDEYSAGGHLLYPSNGPAYMQYNGDVDDIDEDDEYYFQMQDAAEERERALAAGYRANFEQAQKRAEFSGIHTPVGPTGSPTVQDLAKNEEKAAQLRAKLVEKRSGSTSRGPVPGAKDSISNPPPTMEMSENATDKKFRPNSEVDDLVREAREAAEAEDKKSWQYDARTMQMAIASRNDGKASLTGSMLSASAASVAEPSIPLSKKAKKEAKKAKQQANRNGITVQPASGAEFSATGKKNSAPLGKDTRSGKQMDPSALQIKTEVADINANGKTYRAQEKNKMERPITNTIQAEEKPGPLVAPSRSETLLSTCTVQQEAINGSGREPEEAVLTVKQNSQVTPPATKNDIIASTALALVDGTSKSIANPSSLNGTIHKAEGNLQSTAAYSHHFDDLDEWLEITGYHDRANRVKVLGLYRRKAELDRQMAEVERELEQTTTQRARSMRGEGASSTPKRPSVASMAPPPTPSPGEAAIIQQQSPKSSSIETAKAKPATVSKAASIKRAYSPDRGEIPRGPSEKLRRLSSASSQTRAGASTMVVPSGPRRKAVSPGPGIRVRGIGGDSFRGRARSLSPLHPRRASTAREPSPPHHGYGRSPIPSSWNSYRPALHEPNPPASDHFSSNYGRADSRLSRGGSARGARLPDSGSKGASRYFIIKSWNHDNVQISQRDGTWVTQVQNEEILSEAFRTCRNVYLCFSVNKYMAFQGYARMESLPGTAPEPSWVKSLRWPSSPPFYIRWITVAETKFSKVGHLKNALNEMATVLVGRDGQEIDERCGKELCSLIDEEQRSGRGLQH